MNLPRLLACSLLCCCLLSASAPAQDVPERSVDVGGVHVMSLPRPMSYAAARAYRGAGSAAPLAPQGSGGSGVAPLATDVRLPLEVGIEDDAPIQMEITPDGQTALVVCRDSNSIVFMDVGSGVQLGRVLVDEEPVHVALTPDGTRALVSCVSADTLCIIDVASRTLVHSVANAGIAPYRSVSTSDSARAIVGSVGTLPSGNGEFVVVDIASGQILSRIATPVQGPTASWFDASSSGVYFADFELSPDDQRIVLANYATRQVLAYDVASGAQLANVSTGPSSPIQVEIDPSGSKAVVLLASLLGTHQSGLLVLDLQILTHSLVPITPSPFRGDMRMTRDGRKVLFGALEGLYAVDVVTGAEQLVDAGPYELASIERTFNGRQAIVSMEDTKLIDLSTMSILSTERSSLLYCLAASPVAPRALGLAPWLDESVRAYSTANQTLSRLWTTAVGDAIELDGPCLLGLTADQLHAAVACNNSSNVAFVDLEHRTIETVTPVDDAMLAMAVSPVADLALVGHWFRDEVELVDLSLGQVLARIPVSPSPQGIHFSPDGARAYVRSDALSTLTFLDVAGAATHATGSLTLGSGFFLGSELSPAGDVLALLSAAPNAVTLVDTATHAPFAVLPVPIEPYHSAFTPDGTKLVVTSPGGPDLVVIDVAGAGSSVTVVNDPRQLLGLALDAAGRYAYIVAGEDAGGGAVALVVRVLDLQTNSFVQTVYLPQSTILASIGYFPPIPKRLGDRLIVCDSEFRRLLWRVKMAGPASVVEEMLPGAFRIRFAETSQPLGTFVASLPVPRDELQLVHFGGDAVVYCDPATPNSTGLPARVAAHGTYIAGEQPLRIQCDQLPPDRIAMLIFGNAAGSHPPPFGLGTVCVGGLVGRFGHALQNSGAGGVAEFDVDIQALPLAPPLAVAPGDTWRFQVWYRDFVTAPTANLSSAVAVTFE